MFSKLTVVILFLLTVLTRFYKLDWGQGFFFHPDENNMAYAISGLSFSNLNPHFFAYGQFPLYLVFFTQSFINLFNGHIYDPVYFSQAIIGLRVYSAIFSCLTILVFWYLSKHIFKQKIYRNILIFFLIFSPGLIQLSHFGTTESLLILIFSLSLLFAVKVALAKKITTRQIIVCALFLGIGVASKIISLIFIFPLFFSLFLLFIKNKKGRFLIFKQSLALLSLCIFFSIIFSPHNIISFSEFISSIKYETNVASGALDVFYTRQFAGTVPYLFQINKIFPYALGVPLLVFSLAGIILTKYKTIPIIFLSSFLVYFLYTGQLFVKWFRFASPVFPILIIFAVFFLEKIKNKFLLSLIVLLSIVPGIVFFNQVYLKDDNRLIVSNWIVDNIPQDSHILSEDRNVSPLPLSGSYNINNFNFYDLDSSIFLKDYLIQEIYEADYIFVPSRRVYMNHQENSFPAVSHYYKSLFNGDLGFKQFAVLSSSDSLFLDSNLAEETFSVFDHPKILIYKKNKQFDIDQYRRILNL